MVFVSHPDGQNVPIYNDMPHANATSCQLAPNKQRNSMLGQDGLPRRPDDEIDELLDHGAGGAWLLCDGAASVVWG
jgi:hypothetical protein